MVSKLITEVAEGVARAGAEAPASSIKAYHGTPYRFSQFDIQRVGRGEGAQMYGHGLYFTEEANTGRGYRRNINADKLDAINDRMREIARELPQYDIPGEYRQYSDPKGYELAAEYDRLMEDRSALREFNITIGGQDINEVYSSLTSAKATDLDYQKAEIIEQIMIDGDTLGVVQRQEEYDAYDEDVYNWFKETIEPNFDAPGALYEVTIKADKSELLDWNKSVSDQPPAIRDALLAKGISETASGRNVYYGLAADAKGQDAQKLATEAAENLGIKGILYEDPHAQAGSKNFVIFDPRIIEISRQYGIALPMAGLILANQDAEAADSTGLAVDIVPPLRAPTFENDDATGKVLDARQNANLTPAQRARLRIQAKKQQEESIPARVGQFASEVAKPVAADFFGGLFIEGPRQALAGFLDATAEAAKILDEAMGIEDVEYLTIEADPRTVTGAGVRSISQFLTGFSPALKGIRALKVAEKTGKAKTFVESALASGVADATVFDPQEDRLSNLIQEVPALQNPVTEYLAASPEDTDAEGRLKNAVEGLTIGFLGEGLVQGVKLIKNRRALVETAEAEGKTVEELVEEAAATMKGGAPTPDLMPPGQEYIPFSEAAEAVQPTIRVPQFKAGTTEADPEAAQNINLANLNTTDDVATLIDEVAKADSPNINDARRQKITNDELPKLADDLGMTVDDLLARRQGEAFNAEQILAARKILVASGENLVKLANAAKNGSEMDLALFRRAMAQHRAIQSQVSGMTAEAGRALQSFRIVAASSREQERLIKEALETTGGEAVSRDMAAMLSELDSPEKIGRFVKDAHKATKMDMLYEFWINALLSSPTTHMVNITSNAMVAALTVGERKVASVIGRNIQPGEADAQLKGMIDGARDGFRLAWNALKTGEPTDPLQKVEAEKHRAISGENLNIAGFPGRLADFLGEFARVPGRLLTAGDEFFKSVGYRMELYAQAYRQAFNEGLRDEAAAKRVIEIIESPPENIRQSAIDASRYQTFTNSLKETRIRGIGELGQAGEKIRQAQSVGPYARIIIPFVRTPTNIASYTFERTPLAFASRSVRQEIAAGGARRDLALAKIITGSTIMGVSADLALSGHITGAGPSNRDMRNLMRATGWQPYSVKVGNTYYAYNRLDPIGTLLGLAADITEIIGQADEADAMEIAAASAIAVSQNMASKTYLSGVSDFFDSFFSASTDPEGNSAKMERFFTRMAGSVVPGFVASVERTMSPEISATYTMLDRIKSRIPGYSDDLPPRRNIFGEPIVLSGGLGPDIVSGIYSSELVDDPVAEEMINQGYAPGMPRRQIKGVELDAQQYDRYILLYSGIEADYTLKEALSIMFDSRDYTSGSDGPEGTKVEAIQAVFNGYKRMAQQQMLEEDDKLRSSVEAAIEERERKRAGL